MVERAKEPKSVNLDALLDENVAFNLKTAEMQDERVSRLKREEAEDDHKHKISLVVHVFIVKVVAVAFAVSATIALFWDSKRGCPTKRFRSLRRSSRLASAILRARGANERPRGIGPWFPRFDANLALSTVERRGMLPASLTFGLPRNPRTMNSQVASGRIGRMPQVALAVGALAMVALLVVARWVEPDPRGFGTHTRLGLPPCAYQAATGRPCPTCGMTTAFAWFVRGNLARSWGANPAGSLLAPTCLALIPWLLAASARGRPDPFRSWEVPLVGLAVAVVALTVFSWTVRMTLGGR